MNYDILNPILAEYQVTEADLQKRSKNGNIRRKRDYVVPRQIYMYMCRKYTKLTEEEIAMDFSLDHCTLIHGIKTIKNLIFTDKEFALIIDDIEDKIEQTLREKEKFAEYEEVDDTIICKYRGPKFGVIKEIILGRQLVYLLFPTIAENYDAYDTLFEAKTYFEDSLKKFLEVIK
jgi:hypothetical protein